MQQIKIPLRDGAWLVAEPFPDDNYKEIDIWIEKDGFIWQDLAVVRESYDYDKNGNLLPIHQEYDIFVYGKEGYECYTEHFKVNEYEEKEKR